jgi:hypothetical protein
MAPPQRMEFLNFEDEDIPLTFQKTLTFSIAQAGVFQGFVLFITICTHDPHEEDITSWQRDSSSWPNMMVLMPPTNLKVGDEVELHFNADVTGVLPYYDFLCQKKDGTLIGSAQIPERS